MVVEVLPLVHWTPVADAPLGVAGVFNYHGSPIPLMDLSLLLAEQPVRKWMSTRILVIRSATKALVGLLAERVTTTMRQSELEFEESGVEGTKVAIHKGEMIRLVDLDKLLRREACLSQL